MLCQVIDLVSNFLFFMWMPSTPVGIRSVIMIFSLLSYFHCPIAKTVKRFLSHTHFLAWPVQISVIRPCAFMTYTLVRVITRLFINTNTCLQIKSILAFGFVAFHIGNLFTKLCKKTICKALRHTVNETLLLLMNLWFIHLFIAPSAPPFIIKVIEISSTSVCLIWERLNCTEQNGKITGYSLLILHDDHRQVIRIDGGFRIWYVIEELKAGQNYSFALAAINEAGASDYSSPISLYVAPSNGNQ